MKSKLSAQIKQVGQALSRLEEALALPATEINRDATIQRFEFAFELSWKLMKTIAKVKGVPIFSPRDAIRIAAQLKLIKNVNAWFDFLDARNTSSHAYNKKLANIVYRAAKKFAPATRQFLLKTKEIGL